LGTHGSFRAQFSSRLLSKKKSPAVYIVVLQEMLFVF